MKRLLYILTIALLPVISTQAVDGKPCIYLADYVLSEKITKFFIVVGQYFDM